MSKVFQNEEINIVQNKLKFLTLFVLFGPFPIFTHFWKTHFEFKKIKKKRRKEEEKKKKENGLVKKKKSLNSRHSIHVSKGGNIFFTTACDRIKMSLITTFKQKKI